MLWRDRRGGYLGQYYQLSCRAASLLLRSTYHDLTSDKSTAILITNLILHVVSWPIMSQQHPKHNKKTSSLLFVHVLLSKGSKGAIMARLSVHLAQDGHKLDTGDINQINVFTPLTYSSSKTDKIQRSPTAVVHAYLKIGYNPVKRV